MQLITINEIFFISSFFMLFILQVFIPRCKFTIFFHTCKSFLIKIEKMGKLSIKPGEG
jgi:hypothetical protein